MATYTSAKASTTTPIPPRQGIGTVRVVGSFTATAAALTTTDVVKLCPIPAGAAITNVAFEIPTALGSATNTTGISIGDNAQSYATTGQSTRFITTVTATGTTSGVISMQSSSGTSGSLGRFYTTADTVQMTIVTGPATGVTTGVINFLVEYTNDL